jgi:hypothetical protein
VSFARDAKRLSEQEEVAVVLAPEMLKYIKHTIWIVFICKLLLNHDRVSVARYATSTRARFPRDVARTGAVLLDVARTRAVLLDAALFIDDLPAGLLFLSRLTETWLFESDVTDAPFCLIEEAPFLAFDADAEKAALGLVLAAVALLFLLVVVLPTASDDGATVAAGSTGSFLIEERVLADPFLLTEALAVGEAPPPPPLPPPLPLPPPFLCRAGTWTVDLPATTE